jgi:phosphonate transport system substrate-binding protein
VPVARTVTTVLAAAALALLTACGGAPAPGEGRELVISAIPDQDPEKLQRLYGQVGEYLGERLGVPVTYRPVTDYTASVTAFRRGDLDAVFFGGLSGVQARRAVPGTTLLAQRDIDERFRSVFVAGAGTGVGPVPDVAGLAALRGRSLTFGSEVSTSGRLMPQFFLDRAGVAVGDLAGEPGFSGSHDSTIALVAAGTYEVGALSASVWDARVADGTVDPTAVVEVFRTPPYHDYHWVGGPDLDTDFGAGFTDRLRTALLELDGSDPRETAILDLFTAGAFVPTVPENYADIETVAGELGLLR